MLTRGRESPSCALRVREDARTSRDRKGGTTKGGNNHRVDFALFVGLQGGCATRPEETSKI